MFFNERFSLVLLIVCLILASEITCKDPPSNALVKIIKIFSKLIDRFSPGASDKLLEKLTKILQEWTKKIKAENAKQHKGLLSSS
ncbi:hypothetical protein HNY73_019017 [Argiope bruennichi]|uniref:Uncharacterized protein n=1 Tax=Argiope bruennichi TaxID=94029 RepID=A0A8T0EGA4_ARGBR|nr:hypothetical protein HNY73_019017 [Argiope bruennichi]